MVSTVRGDQTVCLYKLMNRLGIEPEGGVVSRLSLKYATALHRCEACSSKQLCNSWLECEPDSAGVVPPFCPNQDILFELQFDQPWITIHGPSVSSEANLAERK
jgi:hypothetical protein